MKIIINNSLLFCLFFINDSQEKKSILNLKIFKLKLKSTINLIKMFWVLRTVVSYQDLVRFIKFEMFYYVK